MKTTTMILSGGDMVHSSPPSNYASMENSSQVLDVVRAPLNRDLVDATAETLKRASADLVQLYKRISLDHELEEGERVGLLRALATAAGQAQSTLRPVVPAGVSVTDISGQQQDSQPNNTVSGRGGWR